MTKKKLSLLGIALLIVAFAINACTKDNQATESTQSQELVFQKANLSTSSLQTISTNFGILDKTNFREKQHSPTSNIYYSNINTGKDYLVSKIAVCDEMKGKEHIYTTFVTSVEDFDKKALTNDHSQIRNGKVTFAFLESGITLERTIVNGVEQNTLVATPNLAAPFPHCFADCVTSHFNDLSFVGAVAFGLQPEVFIVGWTVICTAHCV